MKAIVAFLLILTSCYLSTPVAADDASEKSEYRKSKAVLIGIIYQEHLSKQLVGGYRETVRPENADYSEAVLFVFRGDGVYYFMEVNNELSGNDFEYGTFSYKFNRLTVHASLDDNSNLGTSGLEGRIGLALTDDGFELKVDGEQSASIFSKVGALSEGLVGSWLIEHEDEVVFVFTDDGYFFAMQPMDSENQIGVEYGTYQYDAATGSISFSLILDTSGGSLTSDGAPETVEVDGDTLTFIMTDEESVSFTRIR